MSKNASFWFSIMGSLVVVALFGVWSIAKHVEQFGQAQLIDGLPIKEAQDTFKEFREQTASSLKEFSRLAREAAKESAATTSAEEVKGSAIATPTPTPTQ